MQLSQARSNGHVNGHLGGQTGAPLRPQRLIAIPAGKAGILVTLKLMRALVRDFKKHPKIRQTALDLVCDLPPKSWGTEIRTLYYFVRDEIRFVRDINGVETVHTPIALLEIRQGDCDDKSVLLAALLESIGHPTRFVAVGRRPEVFEHVYVETKMGSQWVALDAAEPKYPGWAPQNMVARLVIHN